MFTDISWSGYLTFMVVVCTVYYLVIGFRFYRSDIMQFISGVKPGKVSSHQTNLKEAFQNQDIFHLAQSLADEMQAYLHQAGRNNLNKEEMLLSLKVLIARYPTVKDSSFKEMIQNLIVTETENYCSIHLSEQELSELW